MKSILSWITCQGNICLLCTPSSKVFVMITSQPIISFHGLFCYTVTLLIVELIFFSVMVSVIYMKAPLSLMMFVASRVKFPLVLPSRSSAWETLGNLTQALTDLSFSFWLQIFFLAYVHTLWKYVVFFLNCIHLLGAEEHKPRNKLFYRLCGPKAQTYNWSLRSLKEAIQHVTASVSQQQIDGSR